ncbi:MAG: hypothetical protein P1P84_02540 [Deferrisomatales bacterium]|nr:hypothetical protein [Deferrisomatales bacterium]
MEYLVGLWCEVAEQCPTGDLVSWSNQDIADAAGWDGDEDSFVAALVDAKFLDGNPFAYRVHDWAEHQSYVCGAPVRIAKARKAAETRWGSKTTTQTKPIESSTDATSMLTAMPPLLPFPSLPCPSKTKSKTKSGGNGRFAPPSPAEVEAYATTLGLTIDAHRFWDFYASNGWKVGKNPMTDWKACVRNWIRRDAQDDQPTSKPDYVPRGPRREVPL